MKRPAPQALRIMHIVGTAVGGSWFFDQATTLRARGHELLAVLPAEGLLSQRLRESGIQVAIVPFKGSSIRDIPRTAKAQYSLIRLVRTFHPDLIHNHLFKAVIMGRIAGFVGRAPAVVSQMPGSVHLDSRLLYSFDRATLWIDDVVIGSCNYIAERYAEIGANHVAVSYYGCDVHRIDPTTSGQEFRDEFGVPPEAPTIGMVAYMYPSNIPKFRDVGMKGHEVFIDAASVLKDKYPSARFFVVGDDLWGIGAYRRQLEERAARLGLSDRMHFTGNRTDIPSVMAAMDVLVNPSLSESASYTMIETLLMERGAVATNVGGLPDTVQDGETGLLVPPRDHLALAEAISHLVDNPGERARMGKLGRQRVLVRFDIQNTVDSLEAIYADVLCRRKSDNSKL